MIELVQFILLVQYVVQVSLWVFPESHCVIWIIIPILLLNLGLLNLKDSHYCHLLGQELCHLKQVQITFILGTEVTNSFHFGGCLTLKAIKQALNASNVQDAEMDGFYCTYKMNKGIQLSKKNLRSVWLIQ